MAMTKEEKEQLAREMLANSGYSDEEIEEILRHAFGDKKPEVQTE